MAEFYTYKNGEQVEIPAIEVPEDIQKCFKVNLPSSEQDYESGNGEGVWACSTDEVLDIYETDKTGVFLVKILNDSMYYPPLKHESVLPVEFRKGQRPVAIFEELFHHYGESKRNEVVQFLMNRKKNE